MRVSDRAKIVLNEHSLPERWLIRGDAEWDASSIMKSFETGYDVEGSATSITGVASISRACRDDLAFCSEGGRSAIEMIAHSRAGIILSKTTLIGLVAPKPGSQLIFVNDPRLAFLPFVPRARNSQL